MKIEFLANGAGETPTTIHRTYTQRFVVSAATLLTSTLKLSSGIGDRREGKDRERDTSFSPSLPSFFHPSQKRNTY